MYLNFIIREKKKAKIKVGFKFFRSTVLDYPTIKKNKQKTCTVVGAKVLKNTPQ